MISENWNSWSKILRINKSLVWRLKIIEWFFTSLLNKLIYNGSTLQGMLQGILQQHNVISFLLSCFTTDINYIHCMSIKQCLSTAWNLPLTARWVMSLVSLSCILLWMSRSTYKKIFFFKLGWKFKRQVKYLSH